MRRSRYNVAMSLDGYIAGPNGEYDWIIMDSAIDFAAMYAEKTMTSIPGIAPPVPWPGRAQPSG